MESKSIPYTSFVVPQGQYEFLRLPFGLKNGPAIFQRFITRIFKDFISKNEIRIYMDDIVVGTKTVDEHLNLLKRVVHRLAEYGLQLKPKIKDCLL